MPSKIQLDENLWFLFICLQKSDYKTIDFNAVGQATSLKSPAARMRYTRLRRQIEGGTLTGTHGIPFSTTAEKPSLEVRKRTRDSQRDVGGVGRQEMFSKTDSVDRKIKSEPGEFSDCYETDSFQSNDSEDELPLAKRRKERIKVDDASSKSSSAAVTRREISSGFERGQLNKPLELITHLDISQSRSEIRENSLNALQNSNPNAHLYVPAESRSDATAQQSNGNENSCDT